MNKINTKVHYKKTKIQCLTIWNIFSSERMLLKRMTPSFNMDYLCICIVFCVQHSTHD